MTDAGPSRGVGMSGQMAAAGQALPYGARTVPSALRTPFRPMRIDVLTLFPDMFSGVLGASILGRAAASITDPAAPDDPDRVRPPVVAYHLHDIRQWSDETKHRKVDAPPYGGGPGMVMQCQPIWDAVQAVEAMDPAPPTRVLLTPKGVPLTQQLAERLAARPRLLLIAGHYEGLDQRVIDRLHAAPPRTDREPARPRAAVTVSPADAESTDRSTTGPGTARLADAAGDDHLLEISVGDYVLSGGELPAMTLIDAVVRLLPGALGHADSARQDSFSEGSDRLLDHPHYTRPPVWDGLAVPDVLQSGDHAKIAAWRSEATLSTTRRVRPDLLAGSSSGAAPGGPLPIVVLRDARPDDLDAIASLHRAAFGRDAEAGVARALADRGDDVVSVVAEAGGRVVGHAVLSPVTLDEQPGLRGLLALDPLAVEPALQRRGLGSALVREAIRQADDARVQRLFVVGDPGFYARFGFNPAAEQGFTSDTSDHPPAALQVLTIRETREVPPGHVHFAAAFAE